MCFPGLERAFMGAGDAAPAGLTDQWSALAADPPMPPPRPGSTVTAPPPEAPQAPGVGSRFLDFLGKGGSGIGQMVGPQPRQPEEREPSRVTADVGPMGEPLKSASPRAMFSISGERGLADVVVPQVDSEFSALQAQRAQVPPRGQNPNGNLRRS